MKALALLTHAAFSYIKLLNVACLWRVELGRSVAG